MTTANKEGEFVIELASPGQKRKEQLAERYNKEIEENVLDKSLRGFRDLWVEIFHILSSLVVSYSKVLVVNMSERKSNKTNYLTNRSPTIIYE